jgi:hypothetical protein
MAWLEGAQIKAEHEIKFMTWVGGYTTLTLYVSPLSPHYPMRALLVSLKKLTFSFMYSCQKNEVSGSLRFSISS